MRTIDDGGPAFPVPAEQSENTNFATPGMTLLDYFAAAAMQGLLASYSADAEIDGLEPRIASQSYDMADAMIAERSKR
jgi:hypothetical protein